MLKDNFKGHTTGFHPQTQKLQPHSETTSFKTEDIKMNGQVCTPILK